MGWLIGFSSWKKVAVFLGLNFSLQAIIVLIIYPEISLSITPLDVQFGLTSESVYQFLNDIGASGRALYYLNEMTLDMLFPVVYSLAYMLLFIELVKLCKLTNSLFKYLALLPFGIAISDVVENIYILKAINLYPVQSDPLINNLVIANMAKHGLSVISLFVALVLIFRVLGLRIMHRLNH